MINEMDFAGAGPMRQVTEKAAAVILKLRDAADKAQLPVIYVNDNFGEWHSERYRLVERALGSKQAHEFVARLAPRDGDYFVIKPQFSGFYSTNLPVLLPKLGVDRLVLTGIAADICVLFTAADAHMRDYELWVPEDAVAAQTAERRRWALDIMKQSMGAEVRPTNRLALAAWSRRKPRNR
jgi:nicotinamidase-related amidase